MTDELKPVRCGCGGEAERNATLVDFLGRDMRYSLRCEDCGIMTNWYRTESEAIEAWNTAMGVSKTEKTTERTAKVIEHDASVTDTDGYIYHRSEYLCGACKKKVIGGDEYCSHCGCRLDWDEDIPMEYFESGGI